MLNYFAERYKTTDLEFNFPFNPSIHTLWKILDMGKNYHCLVRQKMAGDEQFNCKKAYSPTESSKV